MPSIAFIVHLVLDDVSLPQLTEQAESVHDALEKEGFDVESVTPWQRPSLLQQNAMAPGTQLPSVTDLNEPPTSPFSL